MIDITTERDDYGEEAKSVVWKNGILALQCAFGDEEDLLDLGFRVVRSPSGK